MTDTVDTSPTRNVEIGKLQEYIPAKDPAMRKVICSELLITPQVTTDLAFRGYKTDIKGAKVPLERLHQHNTQTNRRSEVNPPYYEGYFQTQSGNIYHFRDVGGQGNWVIEGATSPRQYEIGNAATIEVGGPFTSPKLVDGKAEIVTSPVTQVLLLDSGAAAAMASSGYSDETTDIPRKFRELQQHAQTQVATK